MKKKVAIILPSFLPVPAVLGGAIESTVHLLIDENEDNYLLDILLLSPYNKLAKKLSSSYKHTKFYWIRRNISYNFINLFIRITKKIFFINLDHYDSFLIKRKVKAGKFDKIIIHGNIVFLNALAKVIPRENLIFYIHANLFSIISPENIKIGKLAGQYVCVSEFIKNEAITNAEINSRFVKVIKNPIDLDSFMNANWADRNIERLKYGITSNEVVILFVGRIVEDKGIKQLLEAALQLPETVQYKLLIAGTFGSNFAKSSDLNEFTICINDLAAKLGNKIKFLGYIPNRELPIIHSISDILIMPSLCEEAAGKVAMEGMASGLPIITTIAGGIQEYVPANAAIFVKRNEKLSEHLSAAILYLLINRDLRLRMGIIGKEHSKEFSPKRYYSDYVKLV